MHRLIMMARPGQEVDHKNQNKLDCRRRNLRLATRTQTVANTSARGGKSRFKGVYRRSDGRKWVAQIGNSYLGSFDKEKDAALAYNTAAIKAFGKFASLNKIS